MLRIDADLLIPGRGEPVRDGTVLIDDRTIVYAGATADVPDAAAGAELVRVPTVMPGMWECHGHFIGMRHLDLERVALEPMAVHAARTALDAGRALAAGFTSVREAGGIGVELARTVDEGTVPGPHIYAAGAIISMTGGHGDLHAFDLDWVHSLSRQGGVFQLADGVPECLRAVRLQLRRGARVIKVCASGGVTSEVDHPIHQQFSADELRAIVEEAARADRVVMAHCHGAPGIRAALEAGCHTIEHGTWLDEETAAMMVDADAVLVPTRTIVERMVELAPKLNVPDYAQRKIAMVADRHAEAIGSAIRAGVRIATGTDIALSGTDLPLSWGRNGEELGYLVGLGMEPLQAIEAATANGPLTLGPQAPRSGVLAAEHDADVIAVDGDPLDDIGILADPDRISHVWKAGQLVKQPVD